MDWKFWPLFFLIIGIEVGLFGQSIIGLRGMLLAGFAALALNCFLTDALNTNTEFRKLGIVFIAISCGILLGFDITILHIFEYFIRKGISN